MAPPAVHQREVTVNLESGLHMTPLSRIVKLVQRFNCSMKFRKGEQIADATSMLDLMTLGADRGTVLTVESSGDQAREALDAVCHLFDTNFAGE